MLCIGKELGMNNTFTLSDPEPSKEAFEQVLGATAAGRALAYGGELDEGGRARELDRWVTYLVSNISC